MKILSPQRMALFGMTSAIAVASVGLAFGETRPSLNFYGAPGLMDMPSGEAMQDGRLSISSAHFGPVSRTTLSFQITPRLSASFRYQGIRDWDRVIASPWDTYYDRSFDLRYQILTEGKYVPAVTIGLQDFVGTGVLSGEYIAATKNFGDRVKVTAGLGWGRLGSYGDIGTTGSRPPIAAGEGGEFTLDQWFRGPVAPFAGFEWAVNDKLTFKAEYSSDNYDREAGRRQTFDRESPMNFGLEYRAADDLTLGAYYMYGEEFGVSVHILLNPKQRPMGGVTGPAPAPVKVRPARGADPDAWSPEWVAQAGARETLISNLNKWLEKDGLVIEAMGYDGRTAQVRVRNGRYDAEAQVIGRVARAMTAVMPASVENFEIVPLVRGVPASKVTVRRTDLEALEFTPGAADAMRTRTTVTEPGQPMANLASDPELYPKLSWSFGPYVRTRFFDPTSPLRADLGARLSAGYQFNRTLRLEGSVTQKVIGNLDKSNRYSNSVLPKVRSDGLKYDQDGDLRLETLALSWSDYLGNNLWGRVSVGYFEIMHAGVSAEVLWKPVDSKLGLGAEINYTAQRDTDGGLGFDDYDYRTASGHVSAYYEFNDDFHVQLDVGRYLAGDVGATLTLEREFENGWKVGAFATKTNVSAQEFGEGSFDKGIKIEVPITWSLGTPSTKTQSVAIRPVTRDGGARLLVNDRLYETVRDYHASGLDDQWGRFWK